MNFMQHQSQQQLNALFCPPSPPLPTPLLSLSSTPPPPPSSRPPVSTAIKRCMSLFLYQFLFCWSAFNKANLFRSLSPTYKSRHTQYVRAHTRSHALTRPSSSFHVYPFSSSAFLHPPPPLLRRGMRCFQWWRSSPAWFNFSTSATIVLGLSLKTVLLSQNMGLIYKTSHCCACADENCW